MNIKKVNIIEKLDLAIKQKEKGLAAAGYVISYKEEVFSKMTYMTNQEWFEFETSMKNNIIQPYAHCEYSEGEGDELSEKNGRPPKMASYGSSSRLIYMLSRSKEGFHYEKKLPTTVGGKANLDGFFEDKEHYVFVEAKCHEPYTIKKNNVSIRYKTLYDYINESLEGRLFIESLPSKCGRYMNVNYFVNSVKLERFDLKQMICHLLGIATAILDGKLKKKKIDFIYLLYNPTELDIEASAKQAINAIYEKTCYECNLINFSVLFEVLVNFLIRTKYKEITSEEINAIISNFTFTLASQDNYIFLLQ